MEKELNFAFYGIESEDAKQLVKDILALCDGKQVMEVRQALKMLDSILAHWSFVRVSH